MNSVRLVKQDLIYLIREIAEEGIIDRKIELVSYKGKIEQIERLDQQELSLIKIRRIEFIIFYEKLQ